MSTLAFIPGSQRRTRWAFAVAALTFPIVSGGSAQVSGGQVLAGNASIQQQGLLTTIHAGDQSILRWDRFNIGASETMQFVQPGADARVLNYIGGTTPSQIDGRLLANGQVYLMNPFGISFGRTAVVETAGLFAVAGQIAKDDFLAGVNRFTELRGTIVNEGAISAGAVALVGERVANRGSIVAPGGFVALAAGDEVYLGERGGRIFVNATKAVSPTIQAEPGISNTGSISAGQGRVVLAAGDLYSTAISNDGVVAGRDIALQGQGSGLVLNSNRIDAASSAVGETGGRIEITGEKVRIMDGAVVDASGVGGGGTVLIGGDFQGSNAEIRNADVTYVGPGATIAADATVGGHGGNIIIWANDTTQYHGALSAKGAGSAGAGGFAEVSGAKLLDFGGSANLRGTGGPNGTLLLDPSNIYIAANQTVATAAGMLGTDTSASGGPTTFQATTNATDSLLLTANLTSALANATVSVTTSSGGSATGNITVVSPVSWNGTTSLALNANNNIVVNAGITNAGSGQISLSATGAISIGAGVSSGGNVNLSHDGPLSGTGTIMSGTRVTLSNNGTVGAPGTGNAINLNTPAATLSKGLGAVFINNGGNALSLTNSPPGGGEITAGNLTLATSINTGSNPLTLNSAALTLNNVTVTSGNLTINNSGALTTNGTASLTAPSVTFRGAGAVGTTGVPVSLTQDVSTVTVNKTGTGGVFLTHPTDAESALSILGTAMPGGGTISGGALRLIGPLNATGASITLNSIYWLALQNNDITAATIVVNADGTLTGGYVSNNTTATGGLNATAITLGGSGRVGGFGEESGQAFPLITRATTITLNKSVGLFSSVYLQNRRTGGVSVSGNVSGAGAQLEIASTGVSGSGDEPIAIGAGGLNVLDQSSYVLLTGSAITLTGGVSGRAVDIRNTGAITGSGTLTASDYLYFLSTGTVGAAGAGNAVSINTPDLNVDKDGGAFFVNNGSNPLILYAPWGDAAGMTGGGAITAGNITLGSPLRGGTSNITLNTAELSLNGWDITAGNLTVNNSGLLSGAGSITANSLTLGGSGTVGGVSGNLAPLQANVTSALFSKTGGNTFLANSRPLSVSGTTGNGDASIAAFGAITLPGSLNVGTGTLRLRGTGGISQSAGAITAGAMSAINTGSGNIVLGNTNSIGTFAALNDASAGEVSIRSGVGNFIVGSVTAGGSIYPALTGITTGIGLFTGGNISVTNPTGAIVVNQPVRALGSGNGTVTISGATTINAFVFAPANRSVTIAGFVAPPPQPPPPQPPQPPPIDLSSDTIINVALTTGNASITAARDVILNAPVTATSTGGLSITADTDLNGTGGVLITSNGRLTATGLSGPLTITGSSIVNLGGIGGSGVGAGNAFFVQSGGAISTVQPVNLALQSSAPSGASFVINGGSSGPAILTTSNTIIFPPGGSATVTLNGGSLTNPLLSTAGPVNFGTSPVNVISNTRIAASSVIFGGTINGLGGLSLSNLATFNGTVGGTTPLASLQVDGNATVNSSLTTSGSQTYNAALGGTGSTAAASIILNGSGQVGAAANPFSLNTPSLTLNKTAGAIHVTNGNNALSLAANAMPAGGAVIAGNVTLSTPVNAGAAALTLSAGGSLALGSNSVSAGNLTINHGGLLSGTGTLVASEILSLTGNGTAGASGSDNAIEVRTPALLVNKGAGAVFANTGGGNVGLSAPALPGGGELTSDNLTLTGPLNSGSSPLTVNTAGTLNLGNNAVTAGTLTINNAASLTGTGALIAGQVNFRGGGAIGGANAPIQTQGNMLNFAKTGGESYLVNGGSLSISGAFGNANAAISANGTLSVLGNLSLGAGSLRFVAADGISQSAESVITADSFSALNRTTGNIVLSGSNAVRLFAAQNTAPGGGVDLRSDGVTGSFVGSLPAAGAAFPAVSGVTTQGGNITILNRVGAVNVNQAMRAVGGGSGTINITGTIVNAEVRAAGSTTVTITGNASILPDTVVNAPVTSGNTTVSATRDVIINVPITSTSTGGLSLVADSDNSGAGGILLTSTGSLVANSLTEPLVLRGSSIVNPDGIGGAGLGVGNLLHVQSGGSIQAVQPVIITAQPNAPATAAVVLNGSAANPAIATTGGGIAFSVPGPITLNGGGLTNPLLSASAPITFGSGPVKLAGNTRLVAPSIVFGGTVNGAFGLSLSGAGTFSGAIGGTAPLASMTVDGTSTLGGNIATTGAQTYTGAASLNADAVLGATNSNVTFGSTVNSATATTRNLTVSTGSGAVNVGGAIGGSNALNAIAINSSGNSRVSGLSATSFTSDAGGTLTIAGPVTAGTVTINNPVNIEGAGVSTTGNQTYASTVQIRANARFASSGGSLAFRGTVVPDAQASNRSFEASAPAGSIAAAGDLGADLNRFGSVLLSGRSIAVNNVFSNGSLSLAMGTAANDVVEISGARISSSNGTVTLGATPSKTSPSTRASINKGNAGDLTIDGNQVIFQPYERTSVSGGNLTVIGRNSAVLGTTAVSGSLIVTTPSLSIYQRAAAPVDLGSALGVDNGTDIVASNVDFAIARDPGTGVATTPLNGVPSASAFSVIPLGGPVTTGGVSIATLSPPINAPSSPSVRYLDLRAAGFSGPTIEPSRFGPIAPLLSLVAQGTAAATFEVATSNVQPPAVASGVIHLGNDVTGDEDDTDGPAVPLEKLSPPVVDVELSAALREQLQNLGVFARRLTPEERVARERFLPFYDQVPRTTDVRDRDYEVVDARVSKESAILAVAEWQRQFLKEGTTQSRVLDITTALVRTYEAYRNTGAPDPVGFRNWLEARANEPSVAVALGFVREVGQLFRRLEMMGLTRVELEVAKTQILFRVLQDAPSMRSGFLRRVIDASATSASAPAVGSQR